jgi:hypothetical protein
VKFAVSKAASVAQLIALKPAGTINPTRSMATSLQENIPRARHVAHQVCRQKGASAFGIQARRLVSD